MAFLDGRQNPIKEISKDQLEILFEELADVFGIEWLNSVGNHPVQNLWQRKDPLSTNELFTLSYAMSRLRKIDSSWISHQIKQMVHGDKNNLRGATFELIGINSLINTGSYNVIPAKRNQAGIDSHVVFNDGGQINISLKNYSISRHEDFFIGESEKIKSEMLKTLNAMRIKKLQLFVDSPNQYPMALDWKLLMSKLPKIISQFQGQPISCNIDEKWYISMADLKEPLDPGFISYTIVVSSRYHDNEKLNLFSKMDEAAANLKEHTSDDNNVVSLIYFRLPLTASAKNCMKWAEDYFRNDSDKLISGVLFYQPAIVSDFEGKSMISHHVHAVFSKYYYGWLGRHSNNKLFFSFPVGIVLQEPSEMILTNGKEKIVSVNDRYIFQSGEHYQSASAAYGYYEGHVKQLGPGIQQYVVFQPSRDGQVVINGLFGDQLLIL